MHSLWKNMVRPGSMVVPYFRRRFSDNLPVLTLYTKEQCSLCDDAKEVLQKFSNKFVLKEVDITAPGNEEWKRLYQYDIPVFHFNGKYLMRHRVDEDLFHKKLEEKSII
nr:glutaredoxin-like protein C5orf63 homolog [Lytechinus pictus]